LNATVVVTMDAVSEISTEAETSLLSSVQDYLAGNLTGVTDLLARTKSKRSLEGRVGIYLALEITGFAEDMDNDAFLESAVLALNAPEFVAVLSDTPGFENVTMVTAEDGSVVVDTPAPSAVVVPTVAPAVSPVAAPTEAPVAVAPTEAPVVVVAPAPVAAPTTAPVAAPVAAPGSSGVAKADDKDGLSNGAIAGIIIGVALVVIILGAVLYYCNKGSSDGGAAPAAMAASSAARGGAFEPVSEVVKTDMMYPPPHFQATRIDKTPVASAAAIAAAASGSIIKTGSQIGAEAGSSDASTAAGDTAASGAMSSLKQSMLCREVDAPPVR
jgi:hypothetical protein